MLRAMAHEVREPVQWTGENGERREFERAAVETVQFKFSNAVA